MSTASTAEENFSHLRRHNAIEQGRANALDLLIKGHPMPEVLRQLVDSLEAATPDLKCLIMLLDDSKQVLSPFVGPSLSEAFLQAVSVLPVGPESGCCGAAVHSKQPVSTDDISANPNWGEYAQHAEKAGLKSCWSYPIVSPDGEVFGTFSMYFPTNRTPDEDDIESLKYETKIVALILERARNIQQLEQAKVRLEQRVAERTQALTQANDALKRALEQRNEVQSQLVEMENMAALGTMMSSLTHEINTPVGVAITAASHLRKIQQDALQALQDGTLKRSTLEKFFRESDESTDIIGRNLERSTHLIKTFKQLSIDQHSQQPRLINLSSYVDEILLSLKPRLKRTRHLFCLDIDSELTVASNPGAISQLLINLIMNSAQHAFEADQPGRVFISAQMEDSADADTLLLTYRDNGKGMNAHTLAHLYKPFFTNARGSGGSGLGMHICYDLVVKVLHGAIDCHSSSGNGTEFVIRFPVN